MPVSNNKRKSDKASKTTPAKKAKLSGNQAKKTGAANSKKSTPKVAASKVKKAPPKAAKAKSAIAAKGKPSVKKPSAEKTKPVAKQNGKKATPKKPAKALAAKKVTPSGKKTVTKVKLVSEAKSKTKQVASKKSEVKKPKVAPSKQKLEKAKKVLLSKAKKGPISNANKVPISKAKKELVSNTKKEQVSNAKKEKTQPKETTKTTDNQGKKRKTTESTSEEESPRKRRIITPNKKYADFEVNVSPKRVSELRAFLQDKRKSTPDDLPEKEQQTTEKPSPKPLAVKKQPPKVKKVEVDSDEEEIKVIKKSDMKPAEKLMKKLQKKLEKEAKAASAFKPKADKETTTTKITKIITFNKPKTKMSSLQIKSLAQSPKLQKIPKGSSGTPKSTSKETTKSKEKKAQAASKSSIKSTPKVNHAPEKVVKPKKIKELKREDRPIQVKLAYQKNIKQKDDQKCWVTGIDTFPSGEIVVVDMANKKIKLFNKAFDECLSSVRLDTIPQDISVSPVDASSAYFTKPFSKEGIQKISMSDGKLTLKESFFTNGTNRGIKCTKAGILTSVQDGRYHDLDINCFKIDLLDYEGKSLRTVSVDLSGDRLFKLPLYFTTSCNDKQVIVSDCIRQNSYIVNLDLTGKIKFKYTGLLAPRGLTVDNHDNVYVTEWEQSNVYVLSPTGKRLQVLITDQECQDDGMDGLVKPYQLCFVPNDKHGQLIVSQEGSNTIKVFNILKIEKSDDKVAEAAAQTKKGDKEEIVEPPKKDVKTKDGEETPSS